MTRACTVRTCMDVHTHHVPATQRCCSAGNPKEASSMQCHRISRFPSIDTASSRAGVVGRVQSVTRASVLQACIDIRLDLRAAQTHLHAPLCCDGIIATFTYHQCTIANTSHTNYTGLHTRTHARMRTRSTSACLHALVRLCYGHKHRAQTSCGTCIHARKECA